MQKMMNWSVLLLMVLSLSACAAAAAKKTTKVKCPSCGYEFEVPVHTGH